MDKLVQDALREVLEIRPRNPHGCADPDRHRWRFVVDGSVQAGSPSGP